MKRDGNFQKRGAIADGEAMAIACGCSSAQAATRASARATSSAPLRGGRRAVAGSLGAIEIADKFSLVEVPDALADRIIAALKATKIRGKKVNVRREKTI